MNRVGMILAAAFLLASLGVEPTALAQEGTLRVGGVATTGNDESSKLQQFTVIPQQAAVFGIDLNWKLGQGQYFSLFADRLFLGDERARFEYGKPGGWKVGLALDRSLNWYSNVGRSLFHYAGHGIYQVDDDIQSAVQAAGGAGTLSPYTSRAVPVDLRFHRRSFGVDFEMPLIEDSLVWNGSYKIITRNGRKPISFALFRGNVPAGPDQRIFELPGAIQDSTRELRTGLEFNKGLFHAAAAYISSTFRNDIPYYRFDNPTRSTNSATAGGALLQASVMPDNEADTLEFRGAVQLPAHNRFTVALSRTTMKQNDPLLPYSLNTEIVAPSLVPPYDSVNAKIETTAWMAGWTGGFGLFGCELAYRSYEMKNKTPILEFTSVPRMDTQVEGDAENEPAGWKKNTLKAGVHFDPAPWIRLGVAYDRTQFERPEREVTKNTLTVLQGSVDLKPVPWMAARLSYTDAQQEVDARGEPAEGEFEFGTQFDTSDRDTTKFELHLIFTPIERLEFGLTAGENDNKFPHSDFGVVKDKYRNYGADFNWEISEPLALYGSYMQERFDWNQNSLYRSPPADLSNPLNYWRTETRDKNDTYQIGLSYQATHALAFSIDYSFSKGISDQACLFAAGGNVSGNCTFPTSSTNPSFPVTVYSGWPTVSTKWTWLKTRGTWEVRKNLTVGLEYWNAKFDGQDWALDVMDVFMGNFDPVTAGVRFSSFLGAKIPDYDANVFRLYLDYSF